MDENRSEDHRREEISNGAATAVAILLAVAICLGMGGFYYARNILVTRLMTNHAIKVPPPQNTAAAPATGQRR